MDVQTERIIAKKGNALFENEETWLVPSATWPN